MQDIGELSSRRTYDATGAVKRSAAIPVGVRIGSAIRKARHNERSSKPVHGTHSSPVPHIRKAHWHHFWTGPVTDKKLVLKWLPPIPVNIDDELTTVIRDVKPD